MASQGDQAMSPSATKLVLPIRGGSSSELANKKQKKEAQRRVQHVGVQGPFIKSKWSHVTITFPLRITLKMTPWSYHVSLKGLGTQCPCRHR
jgi:hypothetical protein